MGDHFNDYPQTTGNGGSNHLASERQARTAAINASLVNGAAFKLWKWARDLKDETGDARPLPCTFADRQRDFIPELAAYVRELFPIAYPDYRDNGLDIIFIDLGLDPIVVEEK